MSDNAAWVGLDRRLREELARYGLPEPGGPCGVGALEVLLRHVYNNRDCVYGLKDRLIEILHDRVHDAVLGLRTYGKHASGCEGEVDGQVTPGKCTCGLEELIAACSVGIKERK